MNKITIEYEPKGLEVWWTMNLVTSNGVLCVGRGIIPVDYWDTFVRLFLREDEALVHFLERRL